MSNPDDLILRISSPSLAERAFIQTEAKRRNMSIENLFKYWMQEAKGAAEAGGEG